MEKSSNTKSDAAPNSGASSPKKPPSIFKSELEEEIMKEVCITNGIKFAKLEQQGFVETVKKIEMLFSGVPRLLGFQRFPSLAVLCLIAQDISKIEGLESLPKLRELWICESSIKKIDGLKHCSGLEKLYLYDNKITTIENIAHMKYLEVLWLSSNRISVVENLHGFSYLRDLNLSDNKIDKIGHSLNGLGRLESLNISGNNISSFKDLTNLVQLGGLKQLSLKDPQYAPNPACLLCNYSTHLLYHLPGLERLDTFDISTRNLRDMAESTVIKKKLYYNMKMKTVKRNLAEILANLRREKEHLQKPHHHSIRVLMQSLKVVERELGQLKEKRGGNSGTEEAGSGTESDPGEGEGGQDSVVQAKRQLKKKKEALLDRVNIYQEKCNETERYCGEGVRQVKELSRAQIQRLVTELETGGNIRFEDGNTSDVWFTSCHDLLLSRFCAVDFRDYGVEGVKVHRITRVHNRMLRHRFDEKLSQITDNAENGALSENSTPVSILNRGQLVKKYLEYLLFVWEPELPGGKNEIFRVLEEGPRDAQTYKQLGCGGAVPLSNSLSLAELPRIQYQQKAAKDKFTSDPCPFRQGQLIICKVYLGRSTAAAASDQKPVSREDYPATVDSVFRPKKHGAGGDRATNPAAPPSCECNSRQCQWFVFDHELVLPEYLIDFEYVTKSSPKSPFYGFGSHFPHSNKNHTRSELPPNNDKDVLDMAPHLEPTPKLDSLSEEALLSRRTGAALSLLNLHGCGLTKLKPIGTLASSLKRLTVSFNQLSRLDDLAHMNCLEYLDASFNQITTLEGFKGMLNLKVVDLTWNELHSTRDDLSILRKHCPTITTLDLRHNPWQKPNGLRLRAIGRLRALTKLNGLAVTENEAAAALRMAAGSRISQVSLLAHSRMDKVRPRSLSLASYAQLLSYTSRNKPDRVGETDSQWYSQVTALNLDSQHISKLSNLDRLEHLRWASFNDNDLTKMEGLDACCNLEELSLEDNCIARIEGLSKLAKLRSLNLSSNYLCSLGGGGLERLAHLQYLSAENNSITSLAGLGKLTQLIELYLGNNQITNIREIFHLKALPSLVIVDLLGNPVATEADNYRLYIIYHLKNLKALDGVAIEVAEGGSARDMFGGRLTQDFVAERLGHSNFLEVRELDLPQCGVRHVDLGASKLFANLRSVNLEHNSLTSFNSLIYLVNLRVLCLNHNRVESILAPTKSSKQGSSRGKVQGSKVSGGGSVQEDMMRADSSPLLENLEVLHLGYNGITDLSKLQLGRIPSLKALFLQGNEVVRVEGLDGLSELRELVLDRNKIKGATEYSFLNLWNLVELHLEENRLRDLAHFHHLESLQRLYLGMNRIQDMSEMERLEALPNLIELSVISNPVSRRMMHRPMLVFRQPNLLCIDGIPVSAEERTKAELYFIEQQPPTSGLQQPATSESSLPGLPPYKGTTAIKVTNVQLSGGSLGGQGGHHLDRHGWNTSVHFVADEPPPHTAIHHPPDYPPKLRKPAVPQQQQQPHSHHYPHTSHGKTGGGGGGGGRGDQGMGGARTVAGGAGGSNPSGQIQYSGSSSLRAQFLSNQAQSAPPPQGQAGQPSPYHVQPPPGDQYTSPADTLAKLSYMRIKRP